MAFKNDMTMMLATHDALRRELEAIARVTARADGDPQQILRTALGWQLFKSFLHVHHSVEDDMLWPLMREALADRADAADGLALLDAMEAEHAMIDPLIEAIDAALVDRDGGLERLGGLTDALAAELRFHLAHEEDEGLTLIDATVTPQQWGAFGAEGGKRVGADAPRFMAWMLDGARPEVTAHVLGLLPPPVQQAYRDEWQPAYAQLALWA
jgi:hemerythrin-like domain-containing protein